MTLGQDTHKMRHNCVCDIELPTFRSPHRSNDSDILEQDGKTMIKGNTLHQSKIIPPTTENVTKARRSRQYPFKKSPHDKAKVLHVVE